MSATTCQHPADAVAVNPDRTRAVCSECMTVVPVPGPVVVPTGRAANGVTVRTFPVAQGATMAACTGPCTPTGDRWGRPFASAEDAAHEARRHLRNVHGQG